MELVREDATDPEFQVPQFHENLSADPPTVTVVAAVTTTDRLNEYTRPVALFEEKYPGWSVLPLDYYRLRVHTDDNGA